MEISLYFNIKCDGLLRIVFSLEARWLQIIWFFFSFLKFWKEINYVGFFYIIFVENQIPKGPNPR